MAQYPSMISTKEIKEIVQKLNSHPFNENLTLVSFDEKSQLELLETLNNILIHLDAKHRVDIREEAQDQTVNRITEFLRILGYQNNFDMWFQKSLCQGDRKVIYPLLHWLLTNLHELEQIAYLARFLVPLYIPQEIMFDEEVKMLYEQYQELQAEFKVCHQDLEQLRQQQTTPLQDLKKEIQQLETEKDQLLIKISNFKNKYGSKLDFQQLLEATSMLRKEQEEDAKLIDKLREQKGALDWAEQQLFATRQRLYDVQKAVNSDMSADQMLNIIKNDVKKNREIAQERIGRELSEKQKRLDQIEELLSDGVVNQNEIENLNSEVNKMQREVNGMENKINTAQNPHEDKLHIYKKQVQLVAQKKDKILGDLKDLEEEKNRLEKEVTSKETEYTQTRGPRFLGTEDFRDYANKIREKAIKYKKMKAEHKQIRSELAILTRTDQIVRQRAEYLGEQLTLLERAKGVENYQQTKQALEDISQKKQEVDQKKEETLESISAVVSQITQKMNEKKAKLAPQIKQLRALRSQYAEIQADYEAKKRVYESTMASIETDKQNIETEVNSLIEDVKGLESKWFSYHSQVQLSEVFHHRAQAEQSYREGKQVLSEDFKSHQELYNWKMQQQQVLTQDLRKHQKLIKDNQEINTQQMGLFGDLKKLLNLKLLVLKSNLHSGTRNALMGEDRLVLE